MAAVARGINKTRNAVQLNGFFGKTFYFYNLFSESATLPVYFFVSLLVNPHFLSYYFSALNIIRGFSLNFARTLGRAVDKSLNGSRVNTLIPEKTGSCMQARLNSPPATNMVDEISEELGKKWNVCEFRATCLEQMLKKRKKSWTQLLRSRKLQ